MKFKQIARSSAKWLTAGLGVATASYAGYVGVTWLRYGKPSRASGENIDALMDKFISQYDVADRHNVRVDAPADITFPAASEVDLERCAVVRGIFKAREWILRSKADSTIRPRGLIAETRSLGWGVLAEVPGREIVMGAVTKPWDANPVFRALPPEEFLAFQEPGYVKIVWTLRTNPAGENKSILRTETRAIATDADARRKFRRYRSFLSPGIIVIRRAMLPAAKAEAERRWQAIAA
jgi:hypothetical protein